MLFDLSKRHKNPKSSIWKTETRPPKKVLVPCMRRRPGDGAEPPGRGDASGKGNMSALINRVVFHAADVRQMARAWLEEGLAGVSFTKLLPDEIISLDLRVQEMQDELLKCLGYSEEEKNAKPRRPMSLPEFNALPDEDELEDTKPAPQRRCPADEALAACLVAAAMLVEYDRTAIITLKQVRKVLLAMDGLGLLTRETGGAAAWAASALEADSVMYRRINSVRKHWLQIKESIPTGAFEIALQWLAVASYEAACDRQQIPPEALDDHWAWDPFGGLGLSGPSQEDLERQHAAARELERGVAALVASLHTAAEDGVVSFAESCAVSDVAIALQDALEALANSQEQTSPNPPLVGRDLSFIRLQWDCLTIWRDAANEDVLKMKPAQLTDFKLFTGHIYEVATGVSLEGDVNEECKPGFIQMEGRRPVDNEMEASRRKALAAKTEARGIRIVAVAHPGSAESLISYRTGIDFGGPVGWRKKKAAKAAAEST